jgi:hypothetical protein
MCLENCCDKACMNISKAAVKLLHIINVRTNVLKSARKYDIDETLKLKILIDPLK